MTGLRSRLLLLVLFCLTLATPAHAEKRVALVIGNGFYQYQPILSNPKHDAEDVARALGDLNFDVVLGLDLTRAGMNEKLDEFSRKADGADIAFVYYSGHGMQFGGFNYLLPTDASLDSAADVNPFRLVRIDNVMETLSTVNGPKIVVLDACRDNPVEKELKRRLAALRGARGAEVTRGLSPISGSGLLVAYATQANETALDGKGRNSPFTEAFIKNVADPDTDIRQMFFRVQDEVVRETDGKQRPEISVSLVGEYKLKITITPVNPGEAAPPGGSPPIIFGPSEAERAWGFVKDATSQAVLEDFIRRFPDTIYAKLAREKLEELNKKAQVAVVAPPAVPAVPAGPCGASAVTVSLSSRAAAPLSAAEECSLKPKDVFSECQQCPEMLVVPSGSFIMGSSPSELERDSSEGPQHSMSITKGFAVGRFAVTFDQWDACVADRGCNRYKPSDSDWGRGRRPVVDVSWDDAKTYVVWLSHKTGKDYRLLTEAEREYVTRAGTSTPFWWGLSISTRQANYRGTDTYGGGPKGEWRMQTLPVETFLPNAWGIFQVHGNVLDWVEDCFHAAYEGAPLDGSAWVSGDCQSRVVRGGSWGDPPWRLRAASRGGLPPVARVNGVGFRVARTLIP
jgi:formylglycine-generating enzyme required for sulfatase activity